MSRQSASLPAPGIAAKARAGAPRASVCLGADERLALSAFVHWLSTRFGVRVRELRLFGSRARCEGHEESDLDLLVTIDDLTHAERREVARHSGDAMTDWSVQLSPLVMSAQHWAELRASERRIAREIDRDGIPVSRCLEAGSLEIRSLTDHG